MTTSIITSLIGPICELYYKYKKSLEIQEANINTIRGYGYNTTFAINFGFEIFEPFDLNEIKLQPGLFTTNSAFKTVPSDLSADTTIDVQNLIILQELPTSGIGTVVYRNKTLPLSITLEQDGDSVIGIASCYKACVPYAANQDVDDSIIRSFESDFVNDSALSALIFIRFEDTTITGIDTNWTALPTSLYTHSYETFRFNNGYSQFYSSSANSAFIPSNLFVDTKLLTKLYNVTYMNVYNWANLLIWDPDFTTWYSLNKNLVPEFTQQFLLDYFNVS